MPTVLLTVSRRIPRPGCFVGALRPIAGNTACITTPFSVHCPINLQSSAQCRERCMHSSSHRLAARWCVCVAWRRAHRAVSTKASSRRSQAKLARMGQPRQDLGLGVQVRLGFGFQVRSGLGFQVRPLNYLIFTLVVRKWKAVGSGGGRSRVCVCLLPPPSSSLLPPA